jgi:eukaryotic-like serine/threonine-protein kinase
MPPVPTFSEPQPFTYAPGDVIAGKYALEELIGSGGMGAVFRARNTAIDMPVALKLIRTDLDRELLRGRLLQEARAAAKLAHPAIVRVFDVGTTALGDPFIVMELLQGLSLAKLLEREGRLSSVRVVQLLLPIADALATAHAKGFVHRDVKPDNVFIANDEEGQLQPKLVDFGIVKHELQNGDRQLTQIGAVMGSPDYMSPEQARGLDSIDHRSDIWSFSIVLYEAICGVPPFQSTSYNALLRLIVETEPLSLHDRRASDQELSSIVARGLSKDPNARFASIGQMGKALAGWLSAQGINEDACGVSVEARWLSRTTDPSLPGRVSRSSVPDSWPAPPSGVRAVSGVVPGHLGNAPTVPLAKRAGTPYSMGTTSEQRPDPKRWLYALSGTAAALLLGWFASAHLRAPAEPAAATALSLPPAAPFHAKQPETTPTAAPDAATAPAEAAPPDVAASPVVAPVPALAAKPTSSKKAVGAATRPSRAPASKATPKRPASPKSDLLSPY